MKKTINRLGMTILEPEEGYLLRRHGETDTYKSILLGIYDQETFYEEVIDPAYTKPVEEEVKEKEYESLYVLTSPSGKRFKLVVSDDGDLHLVEI